MLSLKKESIIIFIFLVFYKYLVDLSYIWTYERYEYEGLFKLAGSVESTLLSWCLLILLIPLAMASFHRNTVSARVVSILFLVSVVPTISLIGFRDDYSDVYILLIMIYWSIFLIASNYLPMIIIYNRKDTSSSKGLYLVIIVCSLAILFVWSQYAGFHIQKDLEATIYETRLRAREFGHQIGPLLAYVWLSADAFLPLCVVYFLHTKRYTIVCLLSIIIFINFSLTATKQILGFLALGIFGYYFHTFFAKGKFILYLLVTMLLMSFMEPFIFGTGYLNFIHYRMFFIPGEIHNIYFEFFQTNPVDYFAQGPLKFFADSVYEKNIDFLISDFATGDVGGRANNGLFSDAYRNLGSLGAFIMPILTVLYLKLLDGVCKGHDTKILVVLYVYISFVLIGIPLSTALLSSGLLLTLVFYILLPRIRLQPSIQSS